MGMNGPSNDVPFKEEKNIQRETGSSFDITSPACKRWPRVGGHRPSTAPIDLGAFSQHTPTKRLSPKEFMTRGDGARMFRTAKSPSSSTKKSKLPKVAKMARANPPNTEFRFFYERGDLP